MGFCGTEPGPFPPPDRLDPRSVVPEPLDLPEPPPPPCADDSFVARGAEVFDAEGVGDTVAAARLGAGLGEAGLLAELTDEDAELTGAPSSPAGSSVPAAEHPTTHKPARAATAHSTTDRRRRPLDNSGLSSLTCVIPLTRCFDLYAWIIPLSALKALQIRHRCRAVGARSRVGRPGGEATRRSLEVSTPWAARWRAMTGTLMVTVRVEKERLAFPVYGDGSAS